MGGKDITGQRFGRLVAIEAVEERIVSGQKRKFWRCKCDCGNETIVMQSNLTRKANGVRSCGCLRKELAATAKTRSKKKMRPPVVEKSREAKKKKGRDLTGERFGKLVALKEVEPYYTKSGKRLRQWLCLCDCGNKITVRQQDLIAGNKRHCGCQKKKRSIEKCEETAPRKIIVDLTGQRFGKLTVLREDEPHFTKSGTRLRRWICLCDCGNEVSVLQRNLVSGQKQNCGCIQNWRVANKKSNKNLSGKVFGDVTALYPTDARSYGSVVWHCKCSCGQEFDVSAKRLATNRITSCGHKRNRDFEKKRYGRLVGITPISKRSGYILWHFRCDCGMSCAHTAASLTNNPVSCGTCIDRKKHIAICPNCKKPFPLELDGSETPQYCENCADQPRKNICPVCGKLFIPPEDDPYKSTCSDECWRMWEKNGFGRASAGTYTKSKKCLMCGSTFIGGGNAKYCPKCRGIKRKKKEAED